MSQENENFKNNPSVSLHYDHFDYSPNRSFNQSNSSFQEQNFKQKDDDEVYQGLIEMMNEKDSKNPVLKKVFKADSKIYENEIMINSRKIESFNFINSPINRRAKSPSNQEFKLESESKSPHSIDYGEYEHHGNKCICGCQIF